MPDDAVSNRKKGREIMDTKLNTDLLRSYASGPKIWDAAAIVPDVFALADAGLIEPAPGSNSRYALTEAGRKALELPDTEQDDNAPR